MMEGVEIPEPSQILDKILSQVVFVRALAFGDILPKQI